MTDHPIRQISAADLKAMMDEGRAFELVDVRTPEERAIAFLPQSRLLDREYHDDLLTRDRRTPLVFQCHHGTELFNLVGGIDAWSVTIDADVPRY
jgi:monothiol glutaredoxin